MATPYQPKTTLPLATSASITINNLFDCYNFLLPHQYSDATIGLLTLLLRKGVGDIDFSDVLHQAENLNRQGLPVDFVGSLEDRRNKLPKNEASIEKCLILNRLIKYIQEHPEHFMTILSDIRSDIKAKMISNQITPTVKYPNEFRQREDDFVKRKYAQEIRRLFYFSPNELKDPANLIELYDRTTSHLNILIDGRLKFRSEVRKFGPQEIINIFKTSFLILDQPHYNINPVSMYERVGPGLYTVKISVTIVSLLYDFMKKYPTFIQLFDIVPTLQPTSSYYKLEEPRSIPWMTCHLKGCPDGKSRSLQYAELSLITIRQTSPEYKQVYFAKALQTLQFTIRLRVNLSNAHHSQTYQLKLESLPFVIGQHMNQTPQLLTRVILDDIKRFSKSQVPDVHNIKSFILRYFIHRTGVRPNHNMKTFLDQELSKAKNTRKDFQTLEDIYMDFLVQFVHQIEYMGKHPILAMLYADGLFLGPCDTMQADEVMENLSDSDPPIVALRFNSINVDYTNVIGIPVSARSIQLKPCAVRVVVYRKDTMRHRTFDSAVLSSDLSRFVSEALVDRRKYIRILCDFNNQTNDKIYKSFAELARYYHTQLREFSMNTNDYRPIYDIFDSPDDNRDSIFGDNDDDNILETDMSVQSCSTLVSTAMGEEPHVEHGIIVCENIRTSSGDLGIYARSFSNISVSSEHEQEYQILYDQNITKQDASSQTEFVAQLSLQLDELTLKSVAETAEQRQSQEGQTGTMETFNRPISVPEKEDLIHTEIVSTYLESDTPVLHPVRLHKTPTNCLVVESTPGCCSELVGLTLNTTHEYDNDQDTAICHSEFKRNFKVFVGYRGEHSPIIKENKIINSREPEIFENQSSLRSKLLSIKDEIVFLIISAKLAKLFIPLIHNYLCIEHIYIYQDQKGIQSVTWMDGYPKIQGSWTSLQKLAEKMEGDISSIETCPNRWSRTPDIFSELWTQELSTTMVPTIPDDMKQRSTLPILVTLCRTERTLFFSPKEGVETHEFSVEEDCHRYIQEQVPSSIFLLVVDDYDVIPSKVQSMIQYDSIHALYVFPIRNSKDQHYKTISISQSPKISGIFYNENDLLEQMVRDICFFRQIPMYTPKMSMVEIEFDILSTLNEDKQAFLGFQFFVDVLTQLWSEGDVPLKISDQIKKAGTDLSVDLYVNSTQLILEIDRLIHQFDPISLFKASSYLRFINQQIECSIQKTYPSSITVYHVQLVSNRDLTAMIQNKDNLIIIHTIVLASRSFSATKSICRRACDNGLTAVLFEINIPKMIPLTYLDSDIIIFPMSTVFKIKSIHPAPDTIYHIRMELADATMELMKAQISSTIGECLSWLTFGSYLAHIKQYDAAEKYFEYLQSLSLNTEQHASILTNMSLMYLSMNGKDQETFDCLKKAENLVQSYQEKINEKTSEHTEEHSILDKTIGQYENFAELHRKTGDPVYARLFYEKALKCTSNPTLFLDNNFPIVVTAMVTSHSESLLNLPTTFPTGNTIEHSASLQHDYADALIHDSIVTWYCDENLPVNIQRAMQVKLNQSFKYVNTFTDETKFLNYLDNLSDVSNMQFIISGKRAEELCAYVENSSGKYDVYEFDITHTQPTRRTSSGTWFTFGTVDWHPTDSQ